MLERIDEEEEEEEDGCWGFQSRQRTLFALVVFVELEAFKGSTAGDYLVGELGLVVVALLALVVALAIDLLVRICGFV